MATCYSTAADCAAAGFDFSTDPERDPFASAASGVGVCVHRGTAVALGEADCTGMDSGFRRNMMCGEMRLMFGVSPVSQARTLLPKQPNSVPFEHTIGLRQKMTRDTYASAGAARPSSFTVAVAVGDGVLFPLFLMSFPSVSI